MSQQPQDDVISASRRCIKYRRLPVIISTSRYLIHILMSRRQSRNPILPFDATLARVVRRPLTAPHLNASFTTPMPPRHAAKCNGAFPDRSARVRIASLAYSSPCSFSNARMNCSSARASSTTSTDCGTTSRTDARARHARGIDRARALRLGFANALDDDGAVERVQSVICDVIVSSVHVHEDDAHVESARRGVVANEITRTRRTSGGREREVRGQRWECDERVTDSRALRRQLRRGV